MKVQLIGIALLLFMILMKLTGNSLDAFLVLGGFVGLIIFTSENIVMNEKAYITAEYCSRIVGPLA